MNSMRPTRRDFLRLAGAVAGLVGLAGALQACGGTAAPSVAPASSAAPTRVAPASAKPAASASAKPAASASAAPATSAAAGKFVVSWGSPAGSFAPLWMAKEIGALDKYGIAPEMPLIVTSAAVPAMIGNSIDLMEVSIPPIIPADLNGNQDIVLVASALNKPIISLYALDSIKTPADLKGKIIASDKPGTPVDYAAHVALSLAGLTPKDVILRPVGSAPEITAAMLSGQVPAGMVAPPQSFQVETKGFHLLQDIYSKPYQNVGLMAKRSRLDELAPKIKPLLAAYRDGIQAIYDQPDKAMQVIDKYAKVGDPDILKKTYQFYTTTAAFQKDMQPTLEGIQAMIDFLADNGVPNAKGIKANQFVDLRFLKDLPK